MPPSPGEVVGRRVFEHRALYGLTQAQLAELLTEKCGWSLDRSMVARIEKGQRTVSVDELFLLAAVLDTTPVLLMTPEDETELMSPTPWRSMTSSRARAWITDEVRMWEQDLDNYMASTARAWSHTREYHSQMDDLLATIAAHYGEERIEEVDPRVELPPKARAGVDVVELQLEFVRQRNNWLTHVGAWEWPDPSEDLDLLERHPLFTSRASRELFGQSPADEVLERHAAAKVPISTGQGARDRVRGLVGDVLDVISALARSVEEMVAHARVLPERLERLERPKRSDGSSSPA